MTVTNNYADAWAVVDEHGLDIYSVAPERISAIANWLNRVIAPRDYSQMDVDEIEYLWERFCVDRATVHRVGVKVKVSE